VTTFLIAAALVALTSLAGLFLRMPNIHDADPTSTTFWGDVTAPIGLQPTDGPILVTVEYTVPAADQEAFLSSTAELRRSRLRNGASRWEFYRVVETPDVFVETFAVDSWEEHQAQHRDRLTATDQRIEEATQAFVSAPPRSRHLIPPGTSAPVASGAPDDPAPARQRRRR
jgi:hypothetical protein